MGWLFLQLLPLVSNKHMISLYSRPTRVFSQAIIGWRHAQVPRRYPHLCMHPTDPRLWINGSVAIDLTALDPEPEEELARVYVCVASRVCVCVCVWHSRACVSVCLSCHMPVVCLSVHTGSGTPSRPLRAALTPWPVRDNVPPKLTSFVDLR